MPDFYYQNRDAPQRLIDDEYTEDLKERSTRQRPTLTRKQAAAVWREEREMMFFSLLMRESTSYSAYATDDLMSPDSGRRRFEAWQQQVERDRLHREQALEQIDRKSVV